MQSTIKRISLGALTMAFVLSGLSFGQGASADEGIRHKTPHIGKITEITKNSVVLPIQFSALKKKDVIARVRITNKKTDVVEFRDIAFKLNDRGGKSVLIKNLKPDTEYKFNVKIRRESSKHYSRQSNGKKAFTLTR